MFVGLLRSYVAVIGGLGLLAAVAVAVPVDSHAVTPAAPSSAVITALPDLPVDMNSVGDVLLFRGEVWSSSSKTTTSPTVPSGQSYDGDGINDSKVVIGLTSRGVPAYWQVGVSTTLTPIDISGLKFANGATVGYVGISGIDNAGDAFGFAESTYVDGQATQMAGLLIPGHAGVPSGTPQLVTKVDGTAIEFIVSINAKYEVVADATTAHEGEQLALVDTTNQTVTQTDLALHEGKTASRLLNAAGGIAELTQAGANASVRSVAGAEYQLAGGASGSTATDGLFLNSSNQVAGNVTPLTGSDHSPHAELWAADGSATVLDDTLAPSDSGWTLQYSEGLDDQDDIAGTGELNGVQTGFFLQLHPSSYPPVVNSTADSPATQNGTKGCWTGQNVTVNGAAQPECTLRAAIEAENAGSVDDKTITFAVPAATNGITTIEPATALPALTADGVTIDGTTQTGGFVQLDGSNLGSTIPDLDISGSTDTVQGFMADNSTTAVLIDSATGSDVVRGNVFGLTDTTQTAKTSGVQTGVDIENSPNNLIGGTADGDRNVLSGLAAGVLVHGTKATGNRIQGNYVGTDVSGTQAIGDYDGIGIIDASHTVVGGPSTTPGQGAGNVLVGYSTTSIAGAVSTSAAVTVGGFAVNATGNTIQGNTVGLLADGTAAPTDQGSFTAGVSVVGRVAGTTIGGTTSGTGNVISDSAGLQVDLNGTFVIGSQVLGNLIGTDRTGQTAVSGGGSGYGVVVTGARTSTVGTAGAGANVITAQYEGVVVATSPVPVRSPRFGNAIFPGTSAATSGVLSTVISGNIVGPLADGQTAPSGIVQTTGVVLAGSGDTLGPNNEISDNAGGVSVATAGETVIGNQIGTDSTGLRALPNGTGVAIGAKGVKGFTLGSAGAKPNTISGNLNNVALGAPTLVRNNYIGTTTQGNAAIAPYTGTVPAAITNGEIVDVPVGIVDLAGGSVIGGTRAGTGNVISGNTRDGIDASDPVVVEGNKIGVGADGVTSVPNAGTGIATGDTSQLGGDPTQGAPKVGPWARTGPAGGNIIANNGGGAIVIGKNAAASTVLSNSIYANAGGGIGRAAAAVPGPSFFSAPTQDGDGNTVALITVPNTTVNTVVQIYTADSCSDTAAQGKTLLQTDTTNGAGVVLAVLPIQPVGTELTATLTSNAAISGKAATSDFSPCSAVTAKSATITTSTVHQDQSETGDGTGFTPGEKVDASAHSTPVNLGAHEADSAGDVAVTFTVPATLAAGQHELLLTGRRSGHTAVVGFTVARATSTLTIAATPRSVRYRTHVRLRARLRTAAGAGHRRVQLQRRIGRGAWTRIATTTTAASGRASVAIRPAATAAYRWYHPADGGTDGAVSATVSITVHARGRGRGTLSQESLSSGNGVRRGHDPAQASGWRGRARHRAAGRGSGRRGAGHGRPAGRRVVLLHRLD